MILLAALVVAALLLSTVAFTVDELKDIVLVKTFGKTTQVYLGKENPGLKFKWIYPVQEVVRYDSRTMLFDDTFDQVPTSDKQNLLITMFCAWEIKDPVKFQSTIKTVEAAQDRLRTILRSSKQDVVGRHAMQDFVNTNPDRMKLREIENEVLSQVTRQAMDDYGIHVSMVGVKNLGLTEGVSQGVISTMREERQKDVQKFESAGQAQADAIRARAKSASEKILAFAQAKAHEIESEGDSAAAKYYKEFARNPELGAFLRSLESLKKELQTKTVIVLDSSVLPAVKYFSEGVSELPTRPPQAPKAK
jgi:membrane protease subunit HflC